ncbi:restriction endonuclease [Micromonospora sp. NPDC003776]
MTSTRTSPTAGFARPGPNQIQTWQDAEHNAAEWMRYWGYKDATANPGGSDGGIDVLASNAVAQVKYHASAIGRPALQLLYGARGGASNKQLIFFTGSDYTSTAIVYADENDIALFVYSLDGSMRAMNAIAERISAAKVQSSSKKLTKPSAPSTPTPPGTWRRLIGIGLFLVPLLPLITGRNPFQGPMAQTIMKIITLLSGIYLYVWGRGARKAASTSEEPALEASNAPSSPPAQVAKAPDQSSAPGILRFLSGWLLLCGTIVPPDDGVFGGSTTRDVVKILWIVLSCALMLWGILAKTTPRSKRTGGSSPQAQVADTAGADHVRQAEAVDVASDGGVQHASADPVDVAAEGGRGPGTAATPAMLLHGPDALREDVPAGQPGVVVSLPAEARPALVLADPPVSAGPALTGPPTSVEPIPSAIVPAEPISTTLAASVAPAVDPADAGQTSDTASAPAVLDQRDLHGPDPLRKEARAAWAYRRYLQARGSQPLHPAAGALLLAAVDPDDHVEILAEAAVQFEARLPELSELTRNGTAPFVAVRTMRRWILVERATGAVTVCTGPSFPGLMMSTTRATTWPNAGWSLAVTADDGRKLGFKVFSDDGDLDRLKELIDKGASGQIMLLPEQAEVPALPDLDAAASARDAAPAQRFLPSDWRTSEEIAAAHMRALGFADAELTGGSRDGGLDVVAGTGVAQVKMQAQPVGAPPVQQLRGTRPHSPHHLFYSTSGYTTAACEAAAEIGVYLFTIDRDGTVSPVGDAAAELAEAGVHDPEAVRAVTVRQIAKEYCQGVTDRITAAINATDLTAPGRTGRYPGHHERASRYLHRALENLTEAPGSFESLRSAAVYYHHTELLAHVWFREMGVPYPDGERLRHEPDTLDSFYR